MKDTEQAKKLRKCSAELHYKLYQLFNDYDLTDEEFRYLRLELAQYLIVDEVNWKREDLRNDNN